MRKPQLPKLKLPKIKFPGRRFWLGKKFLISAGLALVVVIGGILILNSNKKDSFYKTAMQNVAEARMYMKAAQTDKTTVQFIVGVREEPYKQDGTAAKPTPFVLVNVNGDDTLKDFNQIDGSVKIGNDIFPVTLLQNPYNPLNFSFDIIKSLTREINPDEAVEVTLFIADNNHPTFQLQNTMDADAITWDKAVRVAADKMGDKLKNQAFETYVTIMHNVAEDSGAFWYVQFITKDGKTHYAVIAPDGSAIG